MDRLDRWRRGLGLAMLGAAAAMLLAGLTVLDRHLAGFGFLAYWLGCAGFALGAFSVAVLDMAVVRRRYRQERRALVREVFGSGPADPSGRQGGN